MHEPNARARERLRSVVLLNIKRCQGNEEFDRDELVKILLWDIADILNHYGWMQEEKQ